MDKEKIISSLKIDKVWDEGCSSQELILKQVVESLPKNEPDRKIYKDMQDLIGSSEYRAIFYDSCVQNLKDSLSESDLELLVKIHQINDTFNNSITTASKVVLDCLERKVGLVKTQ